MLQHPQQPGRPEPRSPISKCTTAIRHADTAVNRSEFVLTRRQALQVLPSSQNPSPVETKSRWRGGVPRGQMERGQSTLAPAPTPDRRRSLPTTSTPETSMAPRHRGQYHRRHKTDPQRSDRCSIRHKVRVETTLQHFPQPPRQTPRSDSRPTRNATGIDIRNLERLSTVPTTAPRRMGCRPPIGRVTRHGGRR